MTKKKRKPSKKKPRTPPSFSGLLLRVIIGTAILVLLVAAAAVLTHHLMLRKQPLETVAQTPKSPEPESIGIPPFEVFPREETPDQPPPPPQKMKRLPQVAIILDDLGYDRRIAEKFLNLEAVLTYALLPHTPHTRSIASAVQRNGREALLHLPMEPVEYPQIDPGPGALLTSMSPDQLIGQLRRNIDAVPNIKGVNNHMGSKMTADSDKMHQVFSVLKKRDLFFVDSRSTARTQCRSSAQLFQLAFTERDVFIDHRQEPEFIRQQIHRLIHIAQNKGSAVGIMHPTRTTYEVFRQQLPELKSHVQMVPVSSVVSIPSG